MAEAPPEGLYPSLQLGADVRATFDDDHLQVRGDPFGPAGISAVELPDGSVWQVDHVDPSRLIAADVESADPAGSPLLLAAFGGDGAMRIVDDAGEAPSPDDPGRGADVAWGRLPPFVGGRAPDDAAVEAGRLVSLADVAGDTALAPLARIVATLEVALRAERAPAGDLLEPLVPEMLRRAERLAAEVDEADLPSLRPKRDVDLLSAFERVPFVGGRSGVALDDLEHLASRIRRLAREPRTWGHRADDDRGVAAEMAAAAATDFFEIAELESVPESYGALEVRRVTPSLLEVETTRSSDERWVRVLRRDGLVLLAQVPLQRDELRDRAQVLVPPDTLDDELDVRIVDAEDLATLASRATDAIREAIRTGRWAASAERAGSVTVARERWRVCARRWQGLGDEARFFAARERATGAGGRFRGEPLMVDRLDPYREAVE